MHLKSSTVEAYVNSLSLYHRLNNLSDSGCSNYIVKTILKGANNLEIYNAPSVTYRNVMSLPLLKLLGHKIANSNWSENSKQLIWTVSCTAFFGSMRIGELLPISQNLYDPIATFLWSDMQKIDDRYLLHIKSTKSKTKGGEYVDIFKFKGHNCCPVQALDCWEKMCKIKSKNSPVFKFENEKFLTREKFSSVVKLLLNDIVRPMGGNISGHSFRAGIPAMLAKHPELVADKHILGWGRWESNAYQSYTRLRTDQKMKIFEKIVYVLNVE